MYKRQPAKSWRPIEQATISYGHGVSVSLMQLVRAYTALARDGDVIDLTLYRRKPGEVVRGERVFRPETARLIRAMMMKTMGRGGTGAQIRVEGYTVAGKTGTAQVVGIAQDAKYDAKKLSRRLHDHALFIAFAPARNPRIALAVLVENGGFGAKAAAPVAREMMDYWLTGENALGLAPPKGVTLIDAKRQRPARSAGGGR